MLPRQPQYKFQVRRIDDASNVIGEHSPCGRTRANDPVSSHSGDWRECLAWLHDQQDTLEPGKYIGLAIRQHDADLQRLWVFTIDEPALILTVSGRSRRPGV